MPEKGSKKRFRSQLYEYDYKTGKIVLKNKICPRCGAVMAHHLHPVPRWHCGRCNYTIFETPSA